MCARVAALDRSQNSIGQRVTATNGSCGDFACGQRRDDESGAEGADFAMGMRQVPSPVISGDFATGVRTGRASRIVGSSASGHEAKPRLYQGIAPSS